MRRSFLLLFFLTISHLLLAQQGTLTGKVTDKKTGEGAIGATVLVTGTTQAAPVELDGSYTLKLTPGTYGITIQSIGYKPLTFTGISIQAGQATTLNGALEENAQALKEVVVTGQKQTGTEVAMIQDLKKSEVVVSGMSNDQIVKTLDRDAAEVVKRIPGVTVQSNNFIVIRGLAERYNTVLLNDALTPSAEVDTRSFSFDILPSSVIDRVLIFKSGSPELPGEFGGGVVKVYTKNSVLENSTSLTVSGWARSTNTFQGGFLQSNHSSTDWLGFDDGQRSLPNVLSGLNGTAATTTSSDQISSARSQLRNEFVPSRVTSRPDARFSLGLNRKFEIGKVYLSNVTSISYSSTQEQTTWQRQRFTAYNPNMPDQLPGKAYDYTDTRSLSAVRLGIIHNYQARINDRNTVELRNFFNQYGTDEVVNRRGNNFDEGEHNDYALHYQSRSIYSGQLGGNHDLGATRNMTLTWAAGYNYVNRNEPDYRQNQQIRPYDAKRPGDANPEPYQVVINIVPTTSARFYSKLNENTYMASGQLERRFAGRDTTSANQYKVRAGFYAEEKERKYDSRYFNYFYGNYRFFDQSIGQQPLETIFSPQNLDPKTGLVLREGTLPQDRYTGKNRLVAGFVSGVLPLTEQLNVTGGVRVEYNHKQLLPGDGAADNYSEKRTFVLPSLNATYNLSERHLLRGGVSKSVNRPEFREIAGYTYYDFTNNFFIVGSNNLRTASIYNADLRYEFYPTRSEMLSVGVFGKRFKDAVEQTTRSATGDLTMTYQNATRAYDLGVEVEARKSLMNMTENRFLQHLSFVMNASLIKSRVQLDTTLENNRNFALTNRPLQGQSPYVVNLGVFYQDDERHWQVSAQYNVIGPRIAFVGDKDRNPSVIELPRNVIDLAVTKGIGKHLELRAGIQNLLNQEVRQYYDFDRNGRINGMENGAAFARYKRGTYSTLGLTYRL
ncbi:TonB-dependent receptor [Hymenobacter pini]|uniref:TonB-dependent receptor n=1 Tax=Hymenobacter pini TaxID=2880879 RepID=UPI001CF4D807|nr:TonB-dependent receptor [Hymenobacter pini]MCA8831886.1 TonB-dependent receptor [Hymenobacter pini]